VECLSVVEWNLYPDCRRILIRFGMESLTGLAGNIQFFNEIQNCNTLNPDNYFISKEKMLIKKKQKKNLTKNINYDFLKLKMNITKFFNLLLIHVHTKLCPPWT